ESPFYSGVPYEAMVVTISQEGMIFFNDERTALKGLAQAFAQAAHDHPEATLVIEADGRVLHSTLAEIYNMAMGAGIRKVALATRVLSVGGQQTQP
ncbi:MAG: biopolymer transporter ExbD, partial [Lentisphaerota bacterium]